MKKLFGYLFITLFIILLIELSFRIAFIINYGGSFFQPSNLIYDYYSELIENPKLHSVSNDTFNIVLLGASVMEETRGNFPGQLQNKLNSLDTKKKYKIINYAIPGHCSLDSKIKFSFIKNLRIDAVLFYHGINDFPFNNCPTNIFSEKYNHSKRLNQINSIVDNFDNNYSVIPLYFDLLSNKKNEKNYLKNNRKPAKGEKHWFEYGIEIKTKKTFYNNIDSIQKICKSKSIPFLFIEYLLYIPDGYHISKIDSIYTPDPFPIAPPNHWGYPNYVKKGVLEHNKIGKLISEENKHVFFIPTANQFTYEKQYFNDACHLTFPGATLLVKNTYQQIKETIDQYPK